MRNLQCIYNRVVSFRFFFLFLANCCFVNHASAIIFFDDADEATNTQLAPSPTGSYADFGWQNTGRYRGFHATMISPKHFLTARHIGTGGTSFSQPAYFNGLADKTFTLANNGARVLINGTDFAIYEIFETFDSYSEIYTKPDEAGKEFVMTGAGRGRGADVTISGSHRGWFTGGASTQRSRWGTNVVDGDQENGSLLYCSFDGSGSGAFDNTEFECQAQSFDSGGAWFIKDTDNVWKIAGVNLGIWSIYIDVSGGTAEQVDSTAIYDATSLFALRYDHTANADGSIPSSEFDFVTSANTEYGGSWTLASRVSSNAADILAVIQEALDEASFTTQEKFDNWLADNGVTVNTAETDDADGDGVSNILEYFTQTNPLDPSSHRDALEVEVLADGRVVFVVNETLDHVADGLSWVIEESVDLENWLTLTVPNLNETETSSTEVDTVNGINVLEFDPYVPSPSEEKVFYRLRLDATF